jgi:hypothetical protein
MWRHLAIVRIDVSEESTTSIVRVIRICELRTTLAVTSNDVLRLLVTANVVPSSPIHITLMTNAIYSYETSLLTRTTRRNSPEDNNHLIQHVYKQDIHMSVPCRGYDSIKLNTLWNVFSVLASICGRHARWGQCTSNKTDILMLLTSVYSSLSSILCYWMITWSKQNPGWSENSHFCVYRIKLSENLIMNREHETSNQAVLTIKGTVKIIYLRENWHISYRLKFFY